MLLMSSSFVFLLFWTISLKSFLPAIGCYFDHYCLPSSNKPGEECAQSSSQVTTCPRRKKYLLYEINQQEGFNLRRDVYIRMALLLKELGEDWILVLPAWHRLYHWKNGSKSSDNQMLPWSMFFDTIGMAKFVPLMESSDFLDLHPQPIDVILSLANFDEEEILADDDGQNEISYMAESVKIKDCSSSNFYQQMDDKTVRGWYSSSGEKKKGKSLVCFQFSGFPSTAVHLIQEHFHYVDSVLINGAETILHQSYGDSLFWSARRSIRFARFLVEIGDRFRAQHLHSYDTQDKTLLERDWNETVKRHGQARGGPYISVHLRRNDFARYRSNDVPSIPCACQQILQISREYNLNQIFIATDAGDSEWQEIKNRFKRSKVSIFRYQNDSLHPGQVAIIDQWISAHAKFFIGTFESTFTFRIQEEREILGFDPKQTFRSLCARCDSIEKICKQPSTWFIRY